MNHEHIRSCLARAGYDAELIDSASTLTVAVDVGKRRITLVHTFPDNLLRAPMFRLGGGYDGKLAHVGVERNGEPGEVCIGDPESTAVNTDRPEQVYLETVQQHVEMLTRLIEDPEYNRAERLREFEAHWEILCREPTAGVNELFVTWDGHNVQRLQVKQPRATSGADLRTRHIASANSQQPASVCGAADWDGRQVVGKALAVPLSGVEPAPATRKQLLPWYFNAVGRADPTGRHELRKLGLDVTNDPAERLLRAKTGVVDNYGNESGIDIWVHDPGLPGSARPEPISGTPVNRLSVAQIMHCKLQRDQMSLVRDAYDVNYAHRADPAALQTAENSLTPEHIRRAEIVYATQSGRMDTEQSSILDWTDRPARDQQGCGMPAGQIIHDSRWIEVEITVRNAGSRRRPRPPRETAATGWDRTASARRRPPNGSPKRASSTTCGTTTEAQAGL